MGQFVFGKSPRLNSLRKFVYEFINRKRIRISTTKFSKITGLNNFSPVDVFLVDSNLWDQFVFWGPVPPCLPMCDSDSKLAFFTSQILNHTKLYVLARFNKFFMAYTVILWYCIRHHFGVVKQHQFGVLFNTKIGAKNNIKLQRYSPPYKALFLN